jgi:hypothetical protein
VSTLSLQYSTREVVNLPDLLQVNTTFFGFSKFSFTFSPNRPDSSVKQRNNGPTTAAFILIVGCTVYECVVLLMERTVAKVSFSPW